MNSPEKVLIVDSNPASCLEIEYAMSNDQFSFVTVNNISEAMGVVSRESVTRIILGEHSSGADTEAFIRMLTEQQHGKETIVCHLSDTDRGVVNFPAFASDITQFGISRTSEIHLLKEKFQALSGGTQPMQQEKVDTLLNEVFGALKDYTKEMCDSIRYARQIQKALLPGESSLKRIMDCFVFNSPKNIVSGDFFWYTVRFNRVILAVADCTGHGVPAALLSIIGHDILNSIVNEKSITEPAQILKQLNQKVHRAFENNDEEGESLKDGMDLAIISFDPATGIVEFAGARRPLYLFKNGNCTKIKGDLHSIGIHSPVSAEFTQHKIKVGPNDFLYLCSDGFADQFGGPQEKKIGSRKFEQLLSEIHLMDTAEQKKHVNSYFQQWKGNSEQTDDVLLLGINPCSLIC